MSYDLTDAPDIVTLIRQNVTERPWAEAVGFVANPDDMREGIVRWTYADLDHHARISAAWLQRRLTPGSRVLLLYPNGLEFVAAFLGCMYAGMIAVPAPLPGRHRHHRQRVATITTHADVSAILTTTAHLAGIEEWAQASGLSHVPVVASNAPGIGDPGDWRPVPLDRSTIALLQYTSGSTGDPKGVMVTHDNVLYNLSAGATPIGWPVSPPMRAGGWVPLYHDLALQGLLMVTLMRGHFVMLMEPISFVRRPLRWLQMIDFHDIHVTFAPNFAYELCVEKVGDDEAAALDLSRWHFAGNASEPVNPVVLRTFAEKFAPAGFRPETFAPIYGMAEATAFVTGRCGRVPRIEQVDLAALAGGEFRPPQPGQPTRDVVGCGPPNEVAEVRIVDPATRQVQPDGGLGEIWLRGRSVAAGYWGRDDNAEVFAATTADGESAFLRTGDLGALYGGELFVHGRLKDTLIVHGRNIYPQDVELELRAQLPELGKMGAVFAGLAETGDADAEGLVVTYEVSKVDRERLPTLAAQVRHTVSREFGVQVAAVLLVSPGTVQRTTSGKVRRSAMRTLFREGQLRALYRDPPERSAEDHDPLPSIA